MKRREFLQASVATAVYATLPKPLAKPVPNPCQNGEELPLITIPFFVGAPPPASDKNSRIYLPVVSA